jgi:hypothetical protein
MKKMIFLFCLVMVSRASGADTPGLMVAGSEPQAAQAATGVTVSAGRFVPLTIAQGKPALVLGNDAGLLEMFQLPAGHSIIGVLYSEPAGAKSKRYVFPSGPVTIAIAGDVGGVVKLSAVVNGASAADAPTVAGTLVVTLTAPLPPPGPGPGPDPPPPPPPVVKSFRVIWVTESATTLTAQQNSVIGAKAIRDYLTAKTTPENNVAGWRHFDPQTVPSGQPTMTALWAAAKPKITTVPCLVVEVNGKAEILPFPANAVEALATLKTYGG